MTYDPKLKEAMKEIEAVCAKYDCAAFVHLSSMTHGEFRYCFPSWSMVRIIDRADGDQAWHLKAYMKSRPKELEATVGWLFSLHDIAINLYLTMEKVKEMIKQHMQVDHTPFKNFTPHQLGPGEVVPIKKEDPDDSSHT